MVSYGRGVSVVGLPCGGSEVDTTMRWMPVSGSFARVGLYDPGDHTETYRLAGSLIPLGWVDRVHTSTMGV